MYSGRNASGIGGTSAKGHSLDLAAQSVPFAAPSAPETARKSPEKLGNVFRLPNPYVRPIAAGACRPAGPPVGLGPAQARPRQPAVHRPARPLWRDPGGGRRLEPGV